MEDRNVEAGKEEKWVVVGGLISPALTPNNNADVR